MSNIIDFDDAKKIEEEEKKEEETFKQAILVLNTLNYNFDNKEEEVFCTSVEESGRLFANRVAKGTVPETKTKKDVAEAIDSFERGLPIKETPRKELCVNRVNGDINDALIKRDTYLEQTQQIPTFDINGGKQKNYQKPSQSQIAFRVFEGENEKGLRRAS